MELIIHVDQSPERSKQDITVLQLAKYWQGVYLTFHGLYFTLVPFWLQLSTTMFTCLGITELSFRSHLYKASELLLINLVFWIFTNYKKVKNFVSKNWEETLFFHSHLFSCNFSWEKQMSTSCFYLSKHFLASSKGKLPHIGYHFLGSLYYHQYQHSIDLCEIRRQFSSTLLFHQCWFKDWESGMSKLIWDMSKESTI